MQARLNTEQVSLCVNGIKERMCFCPSVPESIAAFEPEHLQRPRVERNPIKVARFLDGLVVIGTVRKGDTDTSHQLTVQDGTIAYYRRIAGAAYREPLVDDVRLNGIEEIATDNIAVAGLAHLYEASIAEGEQGWPHIYSLDGGLELARRHVAISA